MLFTIQQVSNALQKVIHPARGIDIITLGIVQDISTGPGKVAFTLYFRQPHDPLKSSLQKACTGMLKEQLDASLEVEINIKTDNPATVKSKKSILLKADNIIAIASGKGGVGKSTVAVNLAIAFARSGARVGLVDADIFGPSVPKMLGVESLQPEVKKIDGRDIIVPVECYGIKTLSIGFFVNPSDATIWRGPMASNAFQQLMRDADWGVLDYLFVDLPPGTSDIHLTLVQSVAVTGAVMVTTPQDVALADVLKGINMFRNPSIQVPILGLIENMAWFTPEELPDNRYYIFGKEGGKRMAESFGLPFLGQIPIVQGIREGGDQGVPAVLHKNKVSEAFKTIADNLAIEIIKRNTLQSPTRIVEIKQYKK